MRHRGHCGRVDANQEQIVKDLRKLGASVWITARMGDGAPDLVVAWRRKNFLFEVKDPDKPPRERLLTVDEVRWHRNWCGQVDIIRTTEEALEVMNG